MEIEEERNEEFQAVLVVEYDDGRMYPIVEDIPKCLLPIANRPLLAYQLDMLVKSGVWEIYIVAPADYQAPLSHFLSDHMSENVVIDLVIVENMMGSVDGLRAVSERIRGDFIYITSDVFCKIPLGELAQTHRLKSADVTMLLTAAPMDEPEKKGGKRKIRLDEEDQEFIGFNDDHRIFLKTPQMEVEEAVDVQKAMLTNAGSFSLRADLLDMGIYVMSYWILDMVCGGQANPRSQQASNDEFNKIKSKFVSVRRWGHASDLSSISTLSTRKWIRVWLVCH